MDEFSIITELQENGPKLLDELLAKEPDSEMLTKYEIMYLDSDDMFENNILLYVDYMKVSKNLWYSLTKSLQPNVINDYIKKFLDVADFYDIPTFVLLFSKILVPNINMKCKVKIFENMINNIIKKKDVQLCFEFIRIHNFLDEFILWAMHVQNNYIILINKKVSPIGDIRPYIRIINITNILLLSWNGNAVNKIDTKYMNSKLNQIKWYSKNNHVVGNSITRLFCTILNSMRVGIIPVYFKMEDCDNEIAEIADRIEKASTNRKHSNELIQLKNDKNKYQLFNKKVGMIVGNNKFKRLIHKFYMDVYVLFNEGANVSFDDSLYDMSYFILRSYDLPKPDNKFCNFVLDVISTKITNNPPLKYDFMKVARKFARDGSFDQTLMLKFIKSLPSLHNDICKSESFLVDQLRKMDLIHETIQFFSKSLDHHIMIDMILSCDQMFQKFLNSLLSCLIDLDRVINNDYEHYHIGRMFGPKPTSIASLVIYHINMVSFLKYFSNLVLKDDKIKYVLLSSEIFSQLVIVINVSVSRLSISLKYDEGLNLGLKKKVDIKKYVNDILDIMDMCYDNLYEFTKCHTYKIDHYNKLRSYISDFELYQHIFSRLDEKDESDDDDNLPDEFKDPLTFVIITRPCLIPMSAGFDEIFFDESSIKKQLMVKEENPYTRCKLTLDEFFAYNKRPDIQEKIEGFKKKFEECKNKC